jgi:hypothetical protein
VQLRGDARLQQALTGTGKDQRGGCFDRCDSLDEGEAGFAAVFDISACRVGDDDCVGAGRRFDRACGREPGAEAFDGSRLLNVERFALRDADLIVDQPDFADATARRQPGSR